MTHVWLVLINDYPDMGGNTVERIFSTKKKAYDWKRKQENPRYYYIEKCGVDIEYED